jgi:sulfite dehydrogenase (quinone) subunit SoeA
VAARAGEARRRVDTSPPAADEVRTTTCYMCACRCGIKVHLKDGRVRYIEGNRDHPVNKGVLCAKGSAGIMHHYSPARLSKPLLRVGPRGSSEFREIEWEAALAIATERLARIRASDPRKLAFFTGRDQSQALTGWWATQFGTPNYAAHGGFCSVNMAAGGLYTIGGSFWEFGEPDWEHAKYFLMFGVAEDHDSNPIKIGLAKLKARGAKFVSINPVRTGYSAIADEWLPITPGADGLFALALAHELLRAGKVDLDYLARYSNAGWLLDEDGLFRRDAEGRPLTAELGAEGTVFRKLAERYLDPRHAPAAVEARTGIAAPTIRRIAAEIAEVAFGEPVVVEQPWTDMRGERHPRMVGRGVAMHAMRGISAHSNGFHTCRALHLLHALIGGVDTPGGFRYKPPFPRPAPPGPKPAGKPDQVAPGQPMAGPPLGFPQGPEDLLVEADGRPRRIDKAFSWEAPIAVHGMMHLVIRNAWAGDPYPIDTLFMYMANMAWNSAMNTSETIAMLTDRELSSGDYKIPFIVYSDAFFSEMVPYADLVLPDTTYLERWDCISLLDRPICDADGPADAIRQPIVAPDRDVRAFQDVLLELGARLKLPGMTNADGSAKFPGGYPDYMANHERRPGIGSLAGFRGAEGAAKGRGAPNPRQLEAYVANGCFWRDEIPAEARYFKHANRAYLDYAVAMGFIDKAEPVVLQLYSEPLQKFRLAAEGRGPVQPPEAHRERVRRYFDPLPFWHPPFEDEANQEGAFPLHAITQRPMAMYHSWGSQNAWLRQIHGHNPLYVPRALAEALGIADGDWVELVSRNGRVRAIAKTMEGVNERTVWTWNAIGKRAGAWNLDPAAGEARKAFLLNHLIDELLPEREGGYRYACADPVTGQAAWYDLRVRLEKADGPPNSQPQFETLKPLPGLAVRPAIRRGR